MYEDLIDLGKEYYIWLKKEKKDRQKFVYPLPQHLTKNLYKNKKEYGLHHTLLIILSISNYLPK